MDIEYNQVRFLNPPLLGRGVRQWTSSKTRSNSYEFLKLPIIAFLNLWSPTPMPMPLFNSLCLIRFFFFFHLITQRSSILARPRRWTWPDQPSRQWPHMRPHYQPALPTNPTIFNPARFIFTNPTRCGRLINRARLLNPNQCERLVRCVTSDKGPSTT